MSKTLSNGTLSLRFMQNAHRAKQQAQVEAEQAKVKDEAEWEVSQELKDAWGLGVPTGDSSNGVTYEASYMPFIFPPSSDDSGETSTPIEPSNHRVLKGRRTFNGDGKEVVPEVKVDVKAGDDGGHAPTDQESKLTNKRLKTISGFQAPLTTKVKDSKRTKTAQMLIREDNGGRLPRPPVPSSSTPQDRTVSLVATGFLKPAGVELPSTTGRSSSSNSKRIRMGEPNEVTDIDGKKRKKKRALA